MPESIEWLTLRGLPVPVVQRDGSKWVSTRWLQRHFSVPSEAEILRDLEAWSWLDWRKVTHADGTPGALLDAECLPMFLAQFDPSAARDTGKRQWLVDYQRDVAWVMAGHSEGS